MGTLRGGNGGEQPPENGSGGVPELPPEWGFIVIPDDASALDGEASTIRRQLRRQRRRDTWRRRLHLRPARPRAEDAVPSLGVPLIIMVIAVLATLTSLFAVAWPDRTGPRRGTATGDAAKPVVLPGLILTDRAGKAVRIRDNVPAAVLLVDGCDCDRLIADTVREANAGTYVLVVTTPGASASGSAPASPPPSPNVSPPPVPPAPSASPSVSVSAPPGVHLRHLIDVKGELRTAVGGLPAPGGGAVMLVATDWSVVWVRNGPVTIADFRDDLKQLR